jgi:hypothetical protein
MMDYAQILLLGEMKVAGRLVDASNATLLTEIELDGEVIQAIYKPISGERPLWDFQSGQLAYRERAAYLISEAMGFHFVPMTILRDGPFGVGATQLWIEIDSEVDLALYFRQDTRELRQVALFDAVINNTDRKIGHLIPDKNGALYICDHGVTFHEEDKLRTVLWQFSGEELDSDEVNRLSALSAKIGSEETGELEELLSENEIAALQFRIGRLLESGVFPAPNPEWPAVPWPPF